MRKLVTCLAVAVFSFLTPAKAEALGHLTSCKIFTYSDNSARSICMGQNKDFTFNGLQQIRFTCKKGSYSIVKEGEYVIKGWYSTAKCPARFTLIVNSMVIRHL